MPDEENTLRRFIRSVLLRIYSRDPYFEEFERITGGLFESAVSDALYKIFVGGVNSLAFWSNRRAANEERDILQAYVEDKDKDKRPDEREEKVRRLKSARKLAEELGSFAALVEGHDIIRTLRVQDFEEDTRNLEEAFGERGRYTFIIRGYDILNSLIGSLPLLLQLARGYGTYRGWKPDSRTMRTIESLYNNAQLVNIGSDIASAFLRVGIAMHAYEEFKKLRRRGYLVQETEDGYRLVRPN
ncbi:MAG: hypothetical protein QXY45_03400 [Candidatus Aenigmatarchaeota archaeon]